MNTGSKRGGFWLGVLVNVLGAAAVCFLVRDLNLAKGYGMAATCSFLGGFAATLAAQRAGCRRGKALVGMNLVLPFLVISYWLVIWLVMAALTSSMGLYNAGSDRLPIVLSMLGLFFEGVWWLHPHWAYVLAGMGVAMFLMRRKRGAGNL